MTEPAAGAGVEDRTSLEEERDFLLRSLRDLDDERAAGDLDPGDYDALHADYTARAAAALRRLQALDAPAAPAPVPDPPGPSPSPSSDARHRHGWLRSRALVVVLVAAVAAVVVSWAVVRASGSRLPGSVATGGAVGEAKVAQLLLAGQQAAAKGDGVTALKDLEAVLRADPNQVQALAAEGWILAQTEQPQLLNQGIGLLQRASKLDPTYPPTYIYLGVSYLTEHDYSDAIPALTWYLGHSPDPALVPRVTQALAQAEAGAARTPPTTTP